MRKKLISLFLLVAFFNLFFFREFGTSAFGLVSSALFVYISYLFINKNNYKTLKLPLLASGMLLAIVNIILFNRTQRVVLLILGLTNLTQLVTLAYLLPRESRFVRSLAEFVFAPLAAAHSYLISAFSIINKVLTMQLAAANLKHKSLAELRPVLTGLLIGIPAVVVLVELFSAADPIFARYAADFFKWFNINVSEQLIFRIILSVFFLMFFAPFILLKGQKRFYNPLAIMQKYTFHKEMTVVMFLVFLTVGSFLTIQAPYIFVSVPAETDLSRFGVATYSEYVKKGFGELLFIASVIYFLVWAGLLALKNKKQGAGVALFYIQLAVLAEFGIFLFSISRRIYLYQLYHGLTLVRIYGIFFLVWLVIIGLTLAGRHFWKKRFVYAEVFLSVLLVIIFGLLNAENFIARVNPPHVNKRTDFIYLSRMSADGAGGWKKAFDYGKEVLMLRNLMTKELINRDERRETAYAGMTVNNLLMHYHELVYKYGTNDEWNEYTDRVFNSMMIKTKGILKKRSDYFRVSRYYPVSFTNLYNSCFDENTKHNYCQRSFYSLRLTDSGNENAAGRDMLDVIFGWNRSEARAYEYMKTNIPIAELLKLQKYFFDLYYKIFSQPAGERDIEVDISFNSPFL